jgi:hypothetical protein
MKIRASRNKMPRTTGIATHHNEDVLFGEEVGAGAIVALEEGATVVTVVVIGIVMIVLVIGMFMEVAAAESVLAELLAITVVTDLVPCPVEMVDAGIEGVPEGAVDAVRLGLETALLLDDPDVLAGVVSGTVGISQVLEVALLLT